MRTWIFQANPDTFDINAYLHSTKTISWTVQQAHLQDQMKVGDQVFLWRSAGMARGPSGVIARCVLVEEPKIREADTESLPFWSVVPREPSLRVGLRVERVANEKELIRREWLKQDPVLAALRILRLATETNYVVPDGQADRLVALWENTGRDWDRAETVAGLWAYHRTYGSSISMLPGSPVAEVALRIGRATQGVYNKVMNFRALDPRDGRAGFSGGGEMAVHVWSEFFDPTTKSLRVDALEAEYLGSPTDASSTSKGEMHSQPALSILADRARITAANVQLVARLCEGATSLGRLSVGFRGGQVPADVFYRADLDLWMAFGEEENRYWTAYGFGVPGPRFTASIITEINPPREGVQRRIAGAFAVDDTGATYLLHRGKIGGGRKDISKSRFLPYYQRAGGVLERVVDGDQASDLIVIGALSDEKLPAHIAAFVHSVASFKARVANGLVPKRTLATESHRDMSFSPEFDGQKQYLAKERVTADCAHGTIVNALQRLLANHGHQTVNDQFRDLLIVDKDGTHRVLFEVKPSAQLYLVYQAVGQLFFHTVQQEDVQRVAVLPKCASPDIRARLTTLGIDLVSFEWEGQTLRFEGVEKFAI